MKTKIEEHDSSITIKTVDEDFYIIIDIESGRSTTLVFPPDTHVMYIHAFIKKAYSRYNKFAQMKQLEDADL